MFYLWLNDSTSTFNCWLGFPLAMVLPLLCAHASNTQVYVWWFCFLKSISAVSLYQSCSIGSTRPASSSLSNLATQFNNYKSSFKLGIDSQFFSSLAHRLRSPTVTTANRLVTMDGPFHERLLHHLQVAHVPIKTGSSRCRLSSSRASILVNIFIWNKICLL